MSHTSDPSHRVESDDQSKSSDHTSGRRGSSPAQNQQQQQAVAGDTKVRGAERKRVPRSSTSSETDSTVSSSGKVNTKTSQKQSSSENFKTQTVTSTTQGKPKGGQKHGPTGGVTSVQQGGFVGGQQGGFVSGQQGGFSTEQQEGHIGTQQGPLGGSFAGTTVSGERRKARHLQEVIRLPEQTQGQVRQVRHRMPTPEPDTLERVYIQRTAAEVVEEITEIPQTPPPRVQERTVVEPAGPPQVVKRVIRVPPRGGVYGGQEASAQVQTGANVQYSDNLLNAGNYYNNQQVPTNFPGGFVDAGAFSGNNYGPAAGNFQQQGAITFSIGGPGAQSQPMPGIGCQPAFCFYM